MKRLLATLALAGCSGAPNTIDVSGYPPDMQRRYALMEQRCTRCHDLERPINAHVANWEQYVARMSRHPGAGIPPEEQKEIALFLEYYDQHREAGK
jgi:hypothetical protein